MRLPALIAALGAASMSSGCTLMAGAAIAGAGMASMQDRTVGRTIDDISASSTIKARLMALDSAGYLRVDVKSVGGQILLAGTVPSAGHKAMAQHIAWSSPAVTDVADELQIGRGHGVVRTSLDNILSAEIRTRLIANRSIKGVNYNIETERGVVYLMGTARTEEELQRVADTVSGVGGVKKVVSYVVVRERNPLEPALLATMERARTKGTEYVNGAERKPAESPPADDFAADEGPYASEASGAPMMAGTEQ